jgi:hypothetical protein
MAPILRMLINSAQRAFDELVIITAADITDRSATSAHRLC